MSDPKANIATLSGLLAKTAAIALSEKSEQVLLGHVEADACLQGGLRRGALHEIFAEPGHEAAATGFAAALCRCMAGPKPILWIRPDFAAVEYGEIAAAGWLELNLDPARLLLLRVGDVISLLKAGHDALACSALGAVVMECPGPSKDFTLAASQRLTLESARTGVTAFWLRFHASPQTSVAETRWQVKALPSRRNDVLWGVPRFAAQLTRNRHGRTGCFALEWSSDHGLFRPTADPGVVVSAPSHRPSASAEEGRA